MPDLQRYAKRRNFDQTPEPGPDGPARHHRRRQSSQGRASEAALAYVIQKHAARHLHYDLRLELDGVLLSWAVPKGPSLDPSTKRLAMQTEDHPLEYRGFEGVIPKEQYGGGTVMVWDCGTWEPIGDARAGYRQGHLKFKLGGKKLRGAWHLVRKGEGKQWLLFKSRDEHAKSNGSSLVDQQPNSTLTGRDLAAIAADPDRVWQSKRRQEPTASNGSRPSEARSQKQAPRQRRALANKPSTARAAGAPRAGSQNLLVQLTSPERVLYEEQGLTKRDLAGYYLQIADWILPQVSDRILTLVRCPGGHQKECFYQKHAKQGMPEHIQPTPVAENGKIVDYIRIDSALGLVSLVQLGVLEIHTWGAHADRPDRPDQLVFDLDPGAGTDWAQLIAGARKVRERLGELGLESFVKTSGSKGLHVVVPVQRRLGWDETKAFCKGVADALVAEEPDRYIATLSKSKRRGKIFIDYLRNGRAATTVCAYSTRARPGAPVSTPIGWEELSPRLSPDQFNIQNLPRRLASLKQDPWSEYFQVRQSITKKMRRAVGLTD